MVEQPSLRHVKQARCVPVAKSSRPTIVSTNGQIAIHGPSEDLHRATGVVLLRTEAAANEKIACTEACPYKQVSRGEHA